VSRIRISSYDGRGFIEFAPIPELSSASFEVVASVQGRVVRNNSLTLIGSAEFARNLRAIEESWKGSATIVGTYDFRLTVSAIRPSNLWVFFNH
jgi:hypothetical protein